MNLLELITKIENTYINNLPSIKEMERLAITIGCSVKYKLSFFARWKAWIYFRDCEYVLTHNVDDERNYTS